MSIDARIETVCSACKVALSVKAALAGKRVKCPKCGGELEIKKPPTPKKKAPLATERQKEFALPLQLNVSYSHPLWGRNAPRNDIVAGEMVLFF